MGRRIGYARVSTGDQHPEAQAGRLRAAGCKQVFTDKGVSGTQARRPEWDQLLGQLQPGDALVCTNLDRIGRSVANLVEVTSVLQERNADLVVLDQAIDTTTPGGRLVFHILAAIAEFERELIIARTRDGQASARRAGNLRRSLGGLPPLGFREDPEGDDWQLDPVQAAWLAEAAQLVLDDPEHNVDAAFRALDPVTDSAGRPVTVKMLRAALARPASAGLIASDGGYLPAAISGPLAEATFTRLGVVFATRKRGRPVETGRYPFGPVLRCGKCGNQLTGEPVRRNGGEPVGYYACANPHKHLPWGGSVARPCKGVSVPAEDVHVLIADAMEQWSHTPVARAAAARADAGSPEFAARRAEATARLAELQDWLADLIEKRNRRYIAPARFAQHEAELTAQIDAASAELDALDEVDATPGVAAGGFLDDGLWDQMTGAEQRELLALAYQTPIDVAPGNGGARALSAADRIDLFPCGVPR